MKKETVNPKQIALIGRADEDQIAQWKKEHALGIYSVVSKGHIAYFKEPDFDEVNCALATQNYNVPLEVYHKLGDDTFIGGSDEIVQNISKHRGAIQIWREKLNGEVAELVNL